MDRMTMNERCDELMNPTPSRGWDDSSRNIMASMRHETCETHCEDCGECLGEAAEQIGLDKYRDVPVIIIGDHDYCEDCALYIRENYPNEGWQEARL